MNIFKWNKLFLVSCYVKAVLQMPISCGVTILLPNTTLVLSHQDTPSLFLTVAHKVRLVKMKIILAYSSFIAVNFFAKQCEVGTWEVTELFWRYFATNCIYTCMLCLWLLFLLQSYLYISRLPLICYLNYGQNCVARTHVWTKLLPLKCKIVYSQWSCLGAVIFPQSASACWGLYGYRESMKNYTCSHNLNCSLERKQHWLGQWNHPDDITYSLHIL